MSEEAFALVDDGTSRAVIFRSDGSTAVRTAEGVVKPVVALTPDEIPTPDD